MPEETQQYDGTVVKYGYYILDLKTSRSHWRERYHNGGIIFFSAKRYYYPVAYADLIRKRAT